MLASFIIPLFNNLALTRACVASLQATLPAGLTHEIILVDDGSTDATRAWLSTLGPPFRVVLNDRNLGYAAANNRAITHARGDVLALLNNDLVFLPSWLEPMLGAHRSLADRAGLIGNLQLNARTGVSITPGSSSVPRANPSTTAPCSRPCATGESQRPGVSTCRPMSSSTTELCWTLPTEDQPHLQLWPRPAGSVKASWTAMARRS